MDITQKKGLSFGWSDEAISLAKQARMLSVEKLDQLVRRLQRSTGRSREACWRFILQAGLKIRDEHRRWTEDEYEKLREHLATHSVAETAKLLGRSEKSVRCAAERNDLSIRNIRCDLMSIHSMAQYCTYANLRFVPGSKKDGWKRRYAPTANGQQQSSPLKHSARSTRATSANSLRRRESPAWRCSRLSTTSASFPSTPSGRNC